MRAVVQTVSRASVTVDGQVVGAIGDGLLVLLGVTHTDDPAVARAIARKVYELRILDDERSAAEVGAPVLVVSQFTLYGEARKGRRPTSGPEPCSSSCRKAGMTRQPHDSNSGLARKQRQTSHRSHIGLTVVSRVLRHSGTCRQHQPA